MIVPGTEVYFEQTIKTNVIGTLNMLGLAKRVGARSVFIMPIDSSKASCVENCMKPWFYVHLQNFVDFNL
jgi:FlaA1/EpsC-like NDP-sugar epimerase